MNSFPLDVLENYLYKNDTFVICLDPKHTAETFHYTIWCFDDIKNITEINNNFIDKLDIFLNIIKEKNIYNNEKMYFTYPPTHNRLHLHIVPKKYISYRPLNELYLYNDDFKDNIMKIIKINGEKYQANRLTLKFKIGIVIINNINNIAKLMVFKDANNLDYIIAIRNKYSEFLEHLVNNYKIINIHLITDNLNRYSSLINYDIKNEI